VKISKITHKTSMIVIHIRYCDQKFVIKNQICPAFDFGGLSNKSLHICGGKVEIVELFIL
jgi:hypothetical protein